MKLSCTFYPRTPIKSKVDSKILCQKPVKTSFYRQFQFSKFSLRHKNECVALIAFKLSTALNTLEIEGMTYQQA